jgi:hypothetical protein
MSLSDCDMLIEGGGDASASESGVCESEANVRSFIVQLQGEP